MMVTHPHKTFFTARSATSRDRVSLPLLLRILKHAGPNPGYGTEYPDKGMLLLLSF